MSNDEGGDGTISSSSRMVRRSRSRLGRLPSALAVRDWAARRACCTEGDLVEAAVLTAPAVLRADAGLADLAILRGVVAARRVVFLAARFAFFPFPGFPGFPGFPALPVVLPVLRDAGAALRVAFLDAAFADRLAVFRATLPRFEAFFVALTFDFFAMCQPLRPDRRPRGPSLTGRAK